MDMVTNEKTRGKKGRPGRKPMTPAEKANAAEMRAAEKAKADNLKPELFIQYQGNETGTDTLIEAAKADFQATKKRTLITDLKLYIKPEENTVYYVANGKHTGKISYQSL